MTRYTGPLLLVGAVLYFAALAPYGLNVDDEGTLLYQIYRVYSGQALYVDFHAGYTPGIFHWNSALFTLFGANVLWIRLCLAAVNGLAVFLLFSLARQLGTGRGAAALAGLVYLALIPFYDGQFAAFNIPYPIWYVTLFWLLSLVAASSAWSRHPVWWLAAGACAGVVFSFKPNSGLLNLAGLLISLCLATARPQAPPAASSLALARLERLLRWTIPAFLVVGLTLFFYRGAGAGGRQVVLFALPLVVVTAAAAYRARRGEPAAGLLRDLTLLGLGFAALIVPWVTWYWMQLGTWPFLRAILFVGTNFDRFYYLPYPHLGLWEIGIGAAFAGLALVGVLLRRRLLPLAPLLAAGALAAAAAAVLFWLSPPPMVEGFQASVVTRLRHLAFGLVLAIEWTAIAVYLARPGSLRAEAPASGSRLARTPPVTLLLLSGAVLMHMQLYPRTDFMHLVPACPLVLVLGAWLLDRLTRLWASPAPSRLGRGGVRLAMLAPVYALVLVLVAPALARIDYLVRSAGGSDDALVRLEADNAPLVIEPAAGRTFLGLSALTRFLRANTPPGDHVFAFPAIDLVSFLAERHNPTRHGYFYPGWPGHEVEAEVIGELGAVPPRWIVSLHDHALFFMAAPLYYYSLRDYVTAAFVPAARIGIFDVLAPRGAAPPRVPAEELPPVQSLWARELAHNRGPVSDRLAEALAAVPEGDVDALAAALLPLDAAAQRRFVQLVRKSRSSLGAAALARLLPVPGLEPTVRELLVRVVAEVGDLTAAPALLTALQDPSEAIRIAAAGDLYAITSRGWLEDSWWVPREHAGLDSLRPLVSVPMLAQWIDDPWSLFTLRAAAIHLAGRLGLEDTAPFLVRVAASAEDNSGFRMNALNSLDQLGLAAPYVPIAGHLMRLDTIVSPALLVRLYRRDPDLGRPVLRAAMQSFSPDERVAAYWVAAAVADAALDDLLERGLTDPEEQVRLASAWARQRRNS